MNRSLSPRRAHLGAWISLLLLAASVHVSTGQEEGEEEYRGPTPVVHLDDQTFERQTQAASGQTTGHWMVNPYVIYAFVNVDENPHLVERFKIETSVPTFLYFGRKKMFRFDPKSTALTPDTLKRMSYFASDGWKESPSEEVPHDVIHIWEKKKMLIILGLAVAFSTTVIIFLTSRLDYIVDSRTPPIPGYNPKQS